MLNILDIVFSKISAERLKVFTGKEESKISSDIKIENIEKRDLEGQKDRKVVEFSFSFKIDYEPDIAKVLIEGNVITGMEKDEAEETIKEWKKSKSSYVNLRILNYILHKCNLKALQLEDEIQIPPHVPMPRFTPQAIEEKEKK